MFRIGGENLSEKQVYPSLPVVSLLVSRAVQAESMSDNAFCHNARVKEKIPYPKSHSSVIFLRIKSL